VLLPAAAWGEKDGTVTNSERRVSRQRRFLPLSGLARPDWWIVSQVARRLGFADGFAFRSAAEIFREHAALSAYENDGARDFDLGGLADLSDEAFDALDPVQWPVRHDRPGGESRFFAGGGFFTVDARARFVAVAPPALSTRTDAQYPLRLNTGRIRDQWHTMTRSGASPRLAAHLPEPFVSVHPEDAMECGLAADGYARVATAHGACVLKVWFDDGQPRGSLFAPIHWSDETAASARVGDLVASCTDPISGQPEAKATPARVEPAAFAVRGFVLTRRPLPLPRTDWWARVAIPNGLGYLLASAAAAAAWRERARAWHGEASDRAEYLDEPRGIYRMAAFVGERLDTCLFIAPASAAAQWNAAREMFARERLDGHQRRLLLSGQSADGAADLGPTVCACFGVGLATVRAALAAGAANTVDEIGAAIRAGTNCGSCRPELKRLIAQARDLQPAS
jgi:assimilatory nitrate reductase catalytic subunit